MLRRVEEALDRTLTTYRNKTVVVVSHVNPIKLSVRYCLDAPLDVVNRMLVAPASLTTLSFYESGASALRQFSALPDAVERAQTSGREATNVRSRGRKRPVERAGPVQQ